MLSLQLLAQRWVVGMKVSASSRWRAVPWSKNFGCRTTDATDCMMEGQLLDPSGFVAGPQAAQTCSSRLVSILWTGRLWYKSSDMMRVCRTTPALLRVSASSVCAMESGGHRDVLLAVRSSSRRSLWLH